MNSASAATRVPFAAERQRLGPIARALVWEECRVGGVVALVCAAVGLAMIALVRPLIGPMGWESQDGFLLLPLSFVPLLTALLLTLNPANSGHLAGGFAQRVLNLPVPVPLAVGIVLAMRSAFAFGSGVLLVAFTGLLYQGAPSLSLPLICVAFYLVVQLLDWTRSVLSGLTTLLSLVGAVVIVIAVARLTETMELIQSLPAAAGIPTVLIGVLFVSAVTYSASIVTVNAARTGRRMGIPEVWEWPGVNEAARMAVLRPFRSPVGAQVWLELRQYGWTLPVGTLLLAPLLAIIPVLVAGEMSWMEYTAGTLYISFGLSAAAHGIRARTVGIRSMPGKPGFSYLRPLHHADMALAKCLTAAVVLVPTIVVVLAIQTAILAPGFVTEIIPYAWANGMTSSREIVWALGSRGVIFGLVAWPLMALGTRTVRSILLVVIAIVAVNAGLELRDYWPMETPSHDAQVAQLLLDMEKPPEPDIYRIIEFISLWAILLIMAGTTLFMYGRAWRRGLYGKGTLFACVGAWLLGAWLLSTALPGVPLDAPRTVIDYINETTLCLALAAIVPLPFVAYLVDVARRRHGAAYPVQKPIQRTRPALHPPLAWGMGGAVVLTVVWLAWPVEPAYRHYLRAQGLPATEAEFRDVYPTVPPNENISLRYLPIMEERDALDDALTRQWRNDGAHNFSDVFVMSHGDWPLSTEQQAATRQYWHEVTAHIAPRLKELALELEGRRPGGYPVTLEGMFEVDLYSKQRSLARECAVDSWYWSQQGDTHRVVDAVIAALAVGDSMADDPPFVSFLVRVAIYGIAVGTLESALEATSFNDADLVRLDAYLANCFMEEEGELTERMLEWERLYNLTAFQLMVVHSRGDSWMDQRAFLLDPETAFGNLALSPAAESMVTLALYDQFLRLPNRTRVFNEALFPSGHDDWFAPAGPYTFLALMSSITTTFLTTTQEVELRTRLQLDIARTAIAAERFRLAHGDWPETLNALVPDFIEAVPVDVFAPAPNAPVRFTLREDGSFVVYSVGMNGIDEDGHFRTDEQPKADDRPTFAVALRGGLQNHE